MATSSTYTFFEEVADFVEEAFERCGVDPASLTARHARSARRSLDFMFSEWSNKGPHLWAIDQQNQLLTASDASYTVPSGTIAILEMVIRRNGMDIPVFPMSRDEYLAIPDKAAEGMPSRFWFDRSATAPMIYLWNTPENSTDRIYYYRMRQLQDVGVASNTLDIPARWQEAVAAGLAAKLAVKYAPDRIGLLTGSANKRFEEAKQEDRERTPTNTRVKYNVGRKR